MSDRDRLHRPHVADGDGVDELLAEARVVEEVLDDDDPADEVLDVLGEDLHARRQRVAQRVPADHGAPPGPRQSRAICTYSERSTSIMPARTMRIEAASVAPSSVSTGSTSRLGCEQRARRPAGSSDTGGRHVEPGEEEQDQQRADHELGQRDDRERGDEIGVVGRPAGPDARRPRRGASASGHHHDRGDHRQHERVRDLARDLVPDRPLAALRVPGRRVAEVAGEEAAEPVEVALRRGPVEPHLRRGSSSSCSGVAVRPSTALAASPGSTSVPSEDEHRDDEQRASTGAIRRRRSGQRMRRGRRRSAAAPRVSRVAITLPTVLGEPAVAVVPAAEVEERARLHALARSAPTPSTMFWFAQTM